MPQRVNNKNYETCVKICKNVVDALSDSGHHEISCVYQKSESKKLVFDFLPHRGSLIQKVGFL